MRLLLVAPLALLLALEVYHCSRRNGLKFALTFFTAAVVFGVVRANVVGFVTWYQDSAMPYAISTPTLRLGFASIVETFGWAFALYGSWFLSEGMLRRIKGRPVGVFPVAFLSAILMGCFAYAVEAAATPMGWWHWGVTNVGSPFIYAVPVIGIMDWVSVAVDFLLPFFIIECSPWKKSKWSFLFAGIVVLHMITHLFPVELPRLLQLFDIWHWVSVWAVGAAALFIPLDFTPPSGGEKRVSLWGKGRGDGLDVLPFVSIGGMLGIVLYAIFVASGDMKLLYSVLPLAAAFLVAASGIVVAWLVAALVVAAGFLSPAALPALLAVGFALVFGLLWPERRKRALRLAAAALAVLGLLSYYPWAHHRSRRLATMKNEVRAVEAYWNGEDYAGVVGQCRTVYGLMAKFAGGEGVLTGMMRAAWLGRDRETFDFAARELRGLGPRFEGVEALWEVADEKEFTSRMRRMRLPSKGGRRRERES